MSDRNPGLPSAPLPRSPTVPSVGGKLALWAEGVSKSFGRTSAVAAVSLQIPSGEVWGLVGPNGAGKTTLMRCLCGLLRMDAGRVEFWGHDVVTDHEEAVRTVGFVPEVPHPFPNLTPFEHLLFVARAFGLEEGWRAPAEDLLQRLDLMDKRDTLCQDLSKGQRQKVHLAMVMLRSPSMLMLDEPLIGLDPKAGIVLKGWIRDRARQGAGALVSSHSLSFVEEICSRIAVMGGGRILATGSLEELREATRSAIGTPFEQVFLKITEP